MSVAPVQASKPRIIYPDSDGAPIAENTIQYEWITKIVGGLRAMFANHPDVFVAGDLFWYPVEGHPEIVAAPDAMVAFGRPKGHRPSYMQWEEAGAAPQVVFEVLSPSNRFPDLLKKFEFYQRHGVEEYYIYDPGPGAQSFSAYRRVGVALVEVPSVDGLVSPRLGVRFEVKPYKELQIWAPDGQPFLTVEELHEREAAARQKAEQERQRADQERRRAEQERQRAEQERQRAEQAVAEARRLREQLKALGQDPG